MLRTIRATFVTRLSCLSVGVALALAPVASHAETLADALVSAYRHSGLLEQNRALLRAADEDVAQAVAATRPIVNWSADLTRRFGSTRGSGGFGTQGINSLDTSVGLTGDLVLYDFGRNKISIDIAKETVLSTRETLRGAEQAVLSRAVIAYMNVRRAGEFVSLRDSNVSLIAQELRAARDRFEVGEVTRTDVSLAEARLAAARSGLAAAQGDLAQAQEEYLAAVGHRPKALSAPGRVALPASSPDAAKTIAYRAHPDMLRSRHDVTAAELGVLLAQAAVKPTVNLNGRIGISESLNSDSFTHSGSVGLNLSGPIYQGGRLNSVMRQSMARRDATRANQHIVRAAVGQNVGNAYADLQVARASRDAGERQVRASTVAFRGVREEATLGARTTLDVLNAEQELLNARANLISSIVDEQIASYLLLSAMGLLTAQELRLNVPRYDPAAYYNLVKDAPIQRSKQGQQLDKVLKSLGKK